MTNGRLCGAFGLTSSASGGAPETVDRSQPAAYWFQLAKTGDAKSDFSSPFSPSCLNAKHVAAVPHFSPSNRSPSRKRGLLKLRRYATRRRTEPATVKGCGPLERSDPLLC